MELREAIGPVVLFSLLAACGGAKPPAPTERPLSDTAVGSRAEQPVDVYVTTGDGARILDAEPALRWVDVGELPPDVVHIRLNDRDEHQAIVGFGATVVEPALEDVPASLRRSVMRRLFHPTSGIGLNLIRIQMFKELERPGDAELTPAELLEAMRARVDAEAGTWPLRFVKEAQALNPDVRVMGSPWSAPAFMKNTKKLGHGRLLPRFYADYADLMVRWVQAWQAAGIPVPLLTLQNEPQYEPHWYPGMRMDVPEQVAFAQALGRSLARAGLNTHVLCHDHNWDDPDSPIAVLDDPEARRWLAGAAFHGYGGHPEAIGRVLSAHPDKDLYGTELTGSYPGEGWAGSLQWQTTRVMALQIVHGARSAMTWQLVRRPEERDRPIIRVHPDEGEGYTLNGEYAVLGHYSRFVKRGARRLGCSFPGESLPYAAAFRNPDGGKVLVANVWGAASTIAVHDGPRAFVYRLPDDGVATFVWRDTLQPSSPIGNGLRGRWFSQPNLSTPHVDRIDPTIDFDFGATPPAWRLPREGFSVRWTGMLRSPTNGPVRLMLTSDDGSRLFLDNRLAIDNWRQQAATLRQTETTLGAEGTWVPITIEYYQGKGNATVAFSWAFEGREAHVVPRESLLAEQHVLPGSGDGLSFSFRDEDATLLSGLDATLDRDFTLGLPSGTQPTLTATWTGSLIADRAGRYGLRLLTECEASLAVGELESSRKASARTGELRVDVDMTAGATYPLSVACTVNRRKATLDQSGVVLQWRHEEGPWQVIPRRQLRSH
jgi:glucosylceramidase